MKKFQAGILIARYIRRWVTKRNKFANILQNFFRKKITKIISKRLAKEKLLWVYWQKFEVQDEEASLKGETIFHSFWFNMFRWKNTQKFYALCDHLSKPYWIQMIPLSRYVSFFFIHKYV